jgi:tyrosine-protein kinase Etk/Wzc
VRRTGVKDLDLLSTGASPKDPAEVLASRRFESTLNAAASRYEVVVVDTAPVLDVTDPVLVSRCAGVNLLVLRPDRIGVRDLKLTLKRFSHAEVRLNGVVLNGVDRARGHRPHGHGLAQQTRAAAAL